MLFITHNLALVRSIAQTAVVFRNGRIVDAGPVQDIFHRPKDPYTLRLMDDVPRLATTTARADSAPDEPSRN
jgi:ABC-type dipeptide/oligopeptide/nickel transport system ATPase component